MFNNSFKYEFAPQGSTPTWVEAARTAYPNPIQAGDKVKLPGHGDLVRIVEVEHYPNGSVAYFSRKV